LIPFPAHYPLLAMDIKEVDAIKKGRKVCKKYKSGDSLEGRH